MAGRNPAAVSKKWSNNLQQAGQQIIESVRAVTSSPTAAAAKKIDVMKSRFIAAADSGKIAAGLNAVSLGDWQNAMVNKGVPRITQGATEGMSKVENFMTKFLPFVAGVQARIKAMPNTTDQDRKNRMLANFDAMKTFKK